MKNLARILLVMAILVLAISALASCGGCKHKSTEVVGAKDATCAEEGYTGDTVCKDCNATVSTGSAIAKKAHTPDGGMVTKNPTCIETGVMTYTCTTCRGIAHIEAIGTVPHSDEYHDALDGTHTHTCAHCTMSENAVHTPVGEGTAFEATCLEPAYTLYVCADCAGSYKQYADGSVAKGHEWNDFITTKNATCSAVGEMSHTCKNCPATESIELPKNPAAHTYENGATVRSTCQEHGHIEQFCIDCNAENLLELPLAGHVYGEDGTADGTGWVHQKCETNGCTVKRSYYDASTLVSADLTAADIPDNKDLSLNMQEASIDLPAALVTALKGGNTESISVKADVADKTTINTENMPEYQKQRLETVDVYEFGIYTDNTYVDTEFAAPVTVTLLYTLKEGEDAEGIVIWFVKDNGEVEEIPAIYDADSETVSFTVSHFSKYAVAYTETQEMKCRRGVHDPVATGTTVPASCRQYGYTEYECSHCHAVTYGNFVEKLDHDYGEVQPATVTCSEGGYTHKICGTCGDILELEYVRATGHQLVGAPTCTEGAKCSVCLETVKPALGHKYTDWAVIVEPTAVSAGLKRRSCLNCGIHEEITLAPEGTVEALVFHSYEEMLTYYVETLGLYGGKLVVDVELPLALIPWGDEADGEVTGTMTPTLTVVFGKDAGGRLTMTAEGGTNVILDGEEVEASFKFLLKNGEIYTYYNVTGGESGVFVTNLDMASGGMDYDVINQVYADLFEELNVFVEQYVGQLRGTIETAMAKLPAGAKEKFAPIVELLDSIETVYAYAALRAGFDTNLQMKDGVEIPTRRDFLNLLDAFFEKSEEDGVITYTYNVSSLMAEIEEIITWFEEHKDTTALDLLIELYGEEIRKVFPAVTDGESLISTLRAEFPGSMLVKDAVAKLLKILIAEDLTVQHLYDAINAVAKAMGGEEMKDFDAEQMLAQYANSTLDQMMMGMEIAETTEQFFDMLAGMLSITLGKIEIPLGGAEEGPSMGGGMGGGNAEQEKYPEGGNVSDIPMGDLGSKELVGEGGSVEDVLGGGEMGGDGMGEEPEGPMTVGILELVGMLDGILSSYLPTGSISFTVDAAGNVLGFDLTLDLDMVLDEENSVDFILGNIRFEKSEDTQVVIPDIFKPLVENGAISYTVDKDGNVVVRGLDPNLDYSFNVNGHYSAPLSELLKKDTVLSAEYGHDVYVLDKKYGYEYMGNSSYILYEGKYYQVEFHSTWDDTEDSAVKSKVKIEDLVADPEAYLPDITTATPVGYLLAKKADEEDYSGSFGNYELTDIAVYASYFGFLYMEDGEWQYIANYNSWTSQKGGKMILGIPMDTMTATPLANILDGLYVSSMMWVSDMHHNYYGKLPENVENSNLGFATGISGIGSTISVFSVLEDGVVYVVDLERLYTENDYYYVVNPTPVKNLPAHDFENTWTVNLKYTTYMFPDGTLLEGKVQEVSLYTYIPTYYYKITDTVFVEVNNAEGYGYAPIYNMDEKYQLPSGEILYVKGRDYDKEGRQLMYGYIQLDEQTCIQVYVDEMGNITYRGGTETVDLEFSRLLDVKGNTSYSDDRTMMILDGAVIRGIEALIGKDDTYSIELVGEGYLDGVPVEEYFTVHFVTPVPEVSLGDIGFGAQMSDEPMENMWYRWFGHNDSYGIEISPNPDGTVSIYTASGEKITIDYRPHGMPVDSSTVKYSGSLSAQNKFPTYTSQQMSTYGGQYVYQNGRFYHYNTVEEASVTYFANNVISLGEYYLGGLQLAIPATDTSPNVYKADVRFENLDGDMVLYFVLEDSEIKVLTGVEDLGRYQLKYEREVSLDTYFSSLKLVVQSDKYWGHTVIVDGVERTIYNREVKVYEPTSLTGLSSDHQAGGLSVSSIEANGRTRYIKEYTSEGRRMILTGAVTDMPANYRVTSQWGSEYTNGKYTIYSIEWDNYSDRVFLEAAGVYYDITGRYYRDYLYTYNEFVEEFMDFDWYYVLQDANGMFVAAYNRVYLYDNGFYFEESDKITDNVGQMPIPDEWHTLYTDENGYKAVQCVTYNGAEPITIGGDSVWVNSMGVGFIEIADDIFMRGYVMEENGGTQAFYLAYMTPAHVTDAELRLNSKLNSYIEKYGDGRVLVLSPEFMEFFKGYVDTEFVFEVNGKGNYWVGYYELLEAFERAEYMKNNPGQDDYQQFPSYGGGNGEGGYYPEYGENGGGIVEKPVIPMPPEHGDKENGYNPDYGDKENGYYPEYGDKENGSYDNGTDDAGSNNGYVESLPSEDNCDDMPTEDKQVSYK